MDDDGAPDSIGEVLERVEEAGGAQERVSVSHIVERIGEDAFAPLLLAPALVVVSPASMILGLSTVCGIMMALIAFQMALGRRRLWLPGCILARSISNSRLDRMVGWLQRPARLLDGLTRKRLTVLVEPPMTRVWALLCMILALTTPVFELVPMSATIIASAISLFALAMMAKDGLLALLGLAALAGAVWLLGSVAA